MIKLKNVLNTVQPIRIKDRFGKFYTILIESNRTTEIENYQVTEDIVSKVNQGSLLVSPSESIKIKQNNPTLTVSEIPVKPDTTIINQDSEPIPSEYLSDDINLKSEVNETNLDNEEINLDNEETKSVYTCEICGNEYASKRGLELHKSKAHK